MRRSILLSRSLKEVENEIASWPVWVRAGMGDAEALKKVYIEIRRHSVSTPGKVNNATHRLSVRKNEQARRLTRKEVSPILE
jgi:hypothetical protein